MTDPVAIRLWLATQSIADPRIWGGLAVMLRHLNAWLGTHHPTKLQCECNR